MSHRTLSSREFNQDTGRAKREANDGPVYITDRGRPSHVLLSFEDYERMASDGTDIVNRLGTPAGIEEVDFEPPKADDAPRPATFD